MDNKETQPFIYMYPFSLYMYLFNMQVCIAFGITPREMKDMENFLIKTLKNQKKN